MVILYLIRGEGLLRLRTREHELLMKSNDVAQGVVELLPSSTFRRRSCFQVWEVESEAIKLVARFAALDFQPLCTVFGGIVAMEVSHAEVRNDENQLPSIEGKGRSEVMVLLHRT
jgi:hypothetical protein